MIVTATNDGGSTPATSGPTAVVAGPPPSNNTLPAISGTPSPGNSLTCSDGAWSNNPTGFAFAWKPGRDPISGATAQTYAVQAADQGPHVDLHGDRAQRRRVLEPGDERGRRHTLRLNWRLRFQADLGQNAQFGTKPTSTAFDGSVNPGGLATTAHFEYGLDRAT